MKRLLCSMLTVCMCASLLCTAASAVEPRSSDYLDSYVCATVANSGGEIAVTATVNAIIKATDIGATDVYIYESSNGSTYTCVEHFSADDYPEMLGSGRHFSKTVATYEGTVGKYYYASVYVYAGDEDGGDTRIYTTAARRAIA